MIAGTDFVFADLDECLPLVLKRWGRTRSVRAVMDEFVTRCRAEGATFMRCPDGVVLITAIGLEGGGFEMRVLLAVSTCPSGAFNKRESDMLTIAKELGASRMSFQTDRPGWSKLLGPEWSWSRGAFNRSVP